MARRKRRWMLMTEAQFSRRRIHQWSSHLKKKERRWLRSQLTKKWTAMKMKKKKEMSCLKKHYRARRRQRSSSRSRRQSTSRVLAYSDGKKKNGSGTASTGTTPRIHSKSSFRQRMLEKELGSPVNGKRQSWRGQDKWTASIALQRITHHTRASRRWAVWLSETPLQPGRCFEKSHLLQLVGQLHLC